MSKLKIKSTRKCPTCGRKLSNGNPPKPMQLDARFKRGMSSIVTTLRLIEDQRGRSAAKAALAELQKALNLD
jgi:hypothetical protein